MVLDVVSGNNCNNVVPPLDPRCCSILVTRTDGLGNALVIPTRRVYKKHISLYYVDKLGVSVVLLVEAAVVEGSFSSVMVGGPETGVNICNGNDDDDDDDDDDDWSLVTTDALVVVGGVGSLAVTVSESAEQKMKNLSCYKCMCE